MQPPYSRVALELRRYNERHDQVLEEIADFVKNHLPESSEVLADLPGSPYTFPIEITPSDLRPDIVVWSKTCHAVQQPWWN